MSPRSLIPTPRRALSPWDLAERRAREAAKALDIDLPDLRVYARDFKTILYAWMRGDVCLYVGQSERGVARLYGRHHVIKDVQDDDVILVWEVPNLTDRERRNREQRLIDALRPTLNYSPFRDEAEPIDPTA